MQNFLLIFIFLISSFLYSQNNSATTYSGASESEEKTEKQAKSKFVKIYEANGKFGFEDYQNNKQAAIYDQIKYGVFGFIVEKNKKFGIANETGLLISQIDYDQIKIENYKYIVEKNKLVGVISNTGEIELPFQFKKIVASNNNFFIVIDSKDNEKIVNKNTGLFLENVEIVNFYKNLIIAKNNNKYGVITDKLVVPYDYDQISIDVENKNAHHQKINTGFAKDLIIKKNNKIGLINAEGKIIYPAENDAITRQDMFGYYEIKKENMFSIYFISNQTKTDFDYSYVYKDGSGYVMATKNNKTGVFSLDGKEIIPFIYDPSSIRRTLENNFFVKKDNKVGVVDVKGKVLIAPIYDKTESFYESKLTGFYRVTNADKSGAVNDKGELIVPVLFDFVADEGDLFKVGMRDPNKVGLFNKQGEQLVPANYHWIKRGSVRNSNFLILEANDKTYNFLNAENKIVFSENILEYGFVLNEERLNNNESYNRIHLLYFKNKKGKFGLINEINGNIISPAIYDNVLECFDNIKNKYFAVQKGKKFGLINENNDVIIPFEYDNIDLDLVYNINDQIEDIQIVVSKNGKYGTIDLQNQVKIPFQYKFLKRVSPSGIFKATKKDQYQLIGFKNQSITALLFDDVSAFERKTNEYGDILYYQALTFNNEKMRVINHEGVFLSSENSTQMHVGYKTFDDLKKALIAALDNPKDLLLNEFVNKIAPSEHLLYFLKYNIYRKDELYVNIPYIKENYLKELLDFKYNYWLNINNGLSFNKTELLDMVDYTGYTDLGVTNKRQNHLNYNSKTLENFLRNSIKVNGFWISSYFMKGNF